MAVFIMPKAGGGSAYLMGTRNKGSPAAGAPRGRLRRPLPPAPGPGPRPRRAAPSPGRGWMGGWGGVGGTRGEPPPSPRSHPLCNTMMAKPPGTPPPPPGCPSRSGERARLQHRCFPTTPTAPPRPHIAPHFDTPHSPPGLGNGGEGTSYCPGATGSAPGGVRGVVTWQWGGGGGQNWCCPGFSGGSNNKKEWVKKKKRKIILLIIKKKRRESGERGDFKRARVFSAGGGHGEGG